MLESKYQADLKDKIRELLPGCFILKNDSGLIQGIPDLTVLYGDRWAMLEVKTSRTAKSQPNQTYYICELGKMSYTAFIYPENEEEILRDLQQALRPRRKARVSQS